MKISVRKRKLFVNKTKNMNKSKKNSSSNNNNKDPKTIGTSDFQKIINRIKLKLKNRRKLWASKMSFRRRRRLAKEEHNANMQNSKMKLQRSAKAVIPINKVNAEIAKKEPSSTSLGSWNTIIHPRSEVESQRLIPRAPPLTANATTECAIILKTVELGVDEEDNPPNISSMERRSFLNNNIEAKEANDTIPSYLWKRHQSMPSLERIASNAAFLHSPLVSRSSFSMIIDYYRLLSMPRQIFSSVAFNDSSSLPDNAGGAASEDEYDADGADDRDDNSSATSLASI